MFDNLSLDAEKWRDAECAKPRYDPDLWFDLHQEQTAKVICKTCPLLLMCAQYAIDEQIPYGIFGALSPHDRQKLRKWR
jgi:hypothetical protein